MNESAQFELQISQFHHEMADRYPEKLDAFDYNIILIGFMGSGKSTVSTYLSKVLVMEEIDVDDFITKKEQKSIKEIFELYGEEYFRNCESNALLELQEKKQIIVSCGGGAVLRNENLRHMKRNGRVVLLTATAETIYKRVKDSVERPLLNNNMGVEYIESLLAKRRERYIEAADIIISTDDRDINEICDEIIDKLFNID